MQSCVAAAAPGSNKGLPSLLADRACLLLLLLVQNHRSRGDVNPFRDAFCSIIDERYGEAPQPHSNPIAPEKS